MPPSGPPVVSWSQVTAPALVLGRSGTPAPLDHDALAAAGVVVVGRSSGGGPVLWDRDLLALDVVLPRAHRLSVRDVVLAYRWLGEAIADALRSRGVGDVEVIGVERAREAVPGGAADACFGGLSPFEVLAGGRKVVGLSQTRRRTGTLLQAGLPLRLDAEGLTRMMGRDAAFARALAATAAGIGEVAPDLTPADLVAAVDAAIARRCDAVLEPSEPSAAERAAIDGRRTGMPPHRDPH
jgi:lipoate---protein ligase